MHIWTIVGARVARVTSHNGWEEHRMGDKGGKKDKEKNKQQQLTKQKQAEQKKQEKARPRTP
jgi:hypothetical protein